MWKYLIVWCWSVGFSFVATASQLEQPANENPIRAAYDSAQLIATLTDRALWLFFLFIILAIAWINDRRKEKELSSYRQREVTSSERLASIVATQNERMERISAFLERLERWLDDH